MRSRNRLVLSAAILVIFVPSFVFCQERFTGHTWRQLPKTAKISMLGGFLSGYRMGYIRGHIQGYVDALEWIEGRLCKELSTQVCAAVKKQIETDDMAKESARWVGDFVQRGNLRLLFTRDR